MGVTALATHDSSAPASMGKYTPFARLGNGGMADVFLAVARGPAGFNKLAVVKRLRNSEASGHLEMFLDEARLAARLNHPNIVHTYEVGAVNGKYFIAMEYLEGQSLQALLAWHAANPDVSGLSDPLVALIAAQGLKGLHHAHELTDFDGTQLGIVHRDISPQNLFIGYGGEVKVLDFGIAKASVNSTHTETGVLKGKVRYMAPEQVREENLDRRVDLFAFGVVLWEMLARRPLFQGDAVSILTRIANEQVPSVLTVRPECAPELDAIALKALQRDPNLRYATADEMRVDLEMYLRGKEDSASEKILAVRMNEAFAATREKVRARVKAFLSELRTDDSSPSGRGVSSMGELPALLEGSGPVAMGGDSTGRPAIARTSVSPTFRARSPWRLAAGIATGVATLLLIGALSLRKAQTPVPAAAPAPTAPAAPENGRVRLETSPPGALVEWNGRPLARTPADIPLPPGAQTLVVTHDEFEPETVTLDVKAGEPLSRTIDLHPKAPPVALVAPAPQPAAGGGGGAAPAAVAHHHGGGAPAPAHHAGSPPAASPAPSPPAAETPASTATAKPKIRVLDENQ